MRIDALARTIETDGVQGTTRATIKMGAKFVRVFSSQIYTDKPLAIIGELLANAWDSHRSAGKSNIPIRLKLPTILDRKLVIYDFGVGMTHDFMMTRFNCFLDSTKDTNDNNAGGFGIGSKTPAAYTDSYTIRCRQNGVARTYIEYKGDDGVLNLAFVGAMQVEEPDGVDVTIEIKEEDIARFYNAAKYVSASFADPDVEVVNSKWTGTPWLHKNEQFWMYDLNWFPENYRYSHIALVGPRTYPLDLHAAGIDCPRGLQFIDGLALQFDIGEVEITPSREALSLCDRTLKAINSKLKHVADGYIDYLRKGLAGQPTFAAALAFSRNWVYRRYVQDLIGAYDKNILCWRGRPFDQPILGLQGSVRRLERNWRGKLLWARMQEKHDPDWLWMSQSLSDFPSIIVTDKAAWRDPIRAWMEAQNLNVCIIVRTADDAKLLLQTAGLPCTEFVRVSDFVQARKQRATVAVAPQTTEILYYHQDSQAWIFATSLTELQTKSPGKKFFALLMNRNKPAEYPDSVNYILSQYHDLMSDVVMLGVPKTKHKLLKQLQLGTFDDYLQLLLSRLAVCPRYQVTLERLQYERSIPCDVSTYFTQLMQHRYLARKTKKQLRLVRQSVRLWETSARGRLDIFWMHVTKVSGQPIPALPYPAWIQAWDELILSFPLLPKLIERGPYIGDKPETKKFSCVLARYMSQQEEFHECIHSQ